MKRIAEPFRLGRHELPNRLVMAPMVTGYAADHHVNQAHLDWYQARVRGGAGLVVVESCGVDGSAIILPGMIGIWDDPFVPGLAKLVDVIHAERVPAILQVVHGGARSYRENLQEPRVGPSDVALLPGPAPRPMTEAEILQAIEAFAQAARRALQAGFDGVEIHAAHYYLHAEFLSPLTNRRRDRWGGSLENRLRFLLETVKAVRQAMGSEGLLFCRMHAVEFLEGGLQEGEILAIAQALEASGVDVIDASGVGHVAQGIWEGQPYITTRSVLPKTAEAGAFVPHVARLKAAVGIPVIAVGKLAEPGVAEAVLARGQADLVAIARQIIADPETPSKLLRGDDDRILRCRECLACFAAIHKGEIRCSVHQER